MKNLGVQIVAFAVGVTCLTLPDEVRAEGVSTTGKGIVGGGLLGAELVVIGEAIAGVDQEWLYYAGAGVGAVGGATGGYFLESYISPKVSVLMLMGGMALSIPAMIVGMDATRRHWPEVDQPEPSRDLPSEPPDPTAGPELAFEPLPLRAGALVRWSEDGFGVALPDVYLTETYTPWERWAFALPRDTNVQVPLLAAHF
jgi:hypothetical protein